MREEHRVSFTLTLDPHEFIRRSLLHVMPKGFHRIRHYGLLASAARRANLAHIQNLLATPPPTSPPEPVPSPDRLLRSSAVLRTASVFIK